MRMDFSSLIEGQIDIQIIVCFTKEPIGYGHKYSNVGPMKQDKIELIVTINATL